MRNSFTEVVVNGQSLIGQLTLIEAESGTLTIRFNDRTVDYVGFGRFSMNRIDNHIFINSVDSRKPASFSAILA